MKESRRARYGLAVAFVCISVLIRMALMPALGYHVPYSTFFPAVACSAAFYGLGPGIFAAVLGGLADDYLLIQPYYRLAIADPESWWGMGMYVLVCLLFVWLGDSQRNVQRRASRRVASSRRASSSISAIVRAPASGW